MKLNSLTFNIVTYRNFSTKRSKDETFSPIAGIEYCDSFAVDFSKIFREALFKHTRQIFFKFLFIFNEFIMRRFFSKLFKKKYIYFKSSCYKFCVHPTIKKKI